MARYADIDKLIADGWHLERHGESGRLLQAMSLADVQTADVVEVVRCKDCTDWRRNVGRVNSRNGHCFYHDTDTNGFDFCSYGERKESDGSEGH